jgi:hypothetical protein
MKAFTDIQQSKKLAEILPMESVDMYYPNRTDTKYQGALPIEWKRGLPLLSQEIPCWSLAALFNILPSATLDTSDDHYCRFSCQQRCTEWHDNPIDACYEMIIKLHEQNIL